MRNLFYYVKKFGQLNFDEFPFNEVDSLLLSQLAYLNWDNIVPDIDENKESINVIDILSPKTIYDLSVGTLDEKRNKIILKLLMSTTRYQGLKVNYFQSHFCSNKVEQFCALTFIFNDFWYLAYRGTDLTLIGWQEDFNMAILDVVPSQARANQYLESVATKSEKLLYLGGHSKGGNLAVYASLSTPVAIKNRIIKIFDHDGPGFNSHIFDSEEFKNLQLKVEKTTCKEAMVGILLNHGEKMKFVDSRSISIFQHDPYNWKITKDGRFKLVKKANLISHTFEKTVSNFIETTSIEDRKEFIDLLFKIAMENPNSTIFDFKHHPINYLKGIVARYKTLKPKERAFVKRILKRYYTLWKHNFKFYLKRSFTINKKVKHKTF